MSFAKTVTVNITANLVTLNSLEQFGLAIGNTDYIGSPVLGGDQKVKVPGRDGYIEFTETLFGEAYYSHRPIKIEFGGIRDPEEWDSVVNNFRRLYEGKTVKLEFSTLPGWYFTGIATIEKFNHKRSLGTFTFSVPYADPFMYQEQSMTFSLYSGASRSVSLDVIRGSTVPKITCSEDCTVTLWDIGGVDVSTYTLTAGTHTEPTLVINKTNHYLRFIGGGTITITWLKGKL